MEVPETRYAETHDGLHLAYQVFGDGPPTVLVPPLMSNVELSWEHELYRRGLEHLARHLRIVHFDKRGIGCSDRFEEQPTLEQRIADISAVMDTVGFDRANLIGLSEGGLMAQQFAVRHPERVDRMVLLNSATGRDSAYVLDSDEIERLLAFFEELMATWGRRPEVMIEVMLPSQLGNASFTRWIARMQRLSANPADMRRQVESILALPAAEGLEGLDTETLVITTTGDRVIPSRMGDLLAQRIPAARRLEVEGDDHFFWVADNWRDIVDPGIEFLTAGPVAPAFERRFATVLFTDLVGSTERSALAGDESWHATLDGHDRVCRQVVTEAGGRLVKSTGDGILATFDSPSSAVDAAMRIRRHLAAIGLPIRAGLHAGEIDLHDDGDISGMAVNLAARVEQAADDGTVFVSSTVRELLIGGSQRFVDRGTRTLKGIEGTWRLYEVVD